MPKNLSWCTHLVAVVSALMVDEPTPGMELTLSLVKLPCKATAATASSDTLVQPCKDSTCTHAGKQSFKLSAEGLAEGLAEGQAESQVEVMTCSQASTGPAMAECTLINEHATKCCTS